MAEAAGLGRILRRSAAGIALAPVPDFQSPWSQLPDVRRAWIEVQGFRAHVAMAGSGPPLVLLHGWPQHSYVWRRQLAELADSHQLICPDLRGFGESSGPCAGGFDQFVDDLAALLDALNISSCGLAGHDWGGWIGFRFAERYPNRVKRFLAINCPPPFQELRFPYARLAPLWYALLVAFPPIPSKLGWAHARLARRMMLQGSRGKRWTEEELYAYTAQFRNPGVAKASRRLYQDFLFRELPTVVRPPAIRRPFSTPTLALAGARDPAVSRALSDVSGLPSAEIEYVEGGGHFLLDEQPELVTQRMRRWFGADAPSPNACLSRVANT